MAEEPEELAMHDALRTLEGAEPSNTAKTLARDRMLQAFDSLDSAGFDDEGIGPPLSGAAAPERAHGEIADLLRGPDLAGVDRPLPRLQRRLPLAAAAAAVLVALLVGGAWMGGLFDAGDAPEVAERSDLIADGSGDDPAAQEFVDDGLPRLVQGRFTTGVLGGTTSFVVDQPLWLVRHETGLVRLVADVDDPTSASLVLARPGVPNEVVGAGPVTDYLGSDAAGVSFQLQPLDVGGVSTTFARGRYSAPGCVDTEPCLVLYEAPMTLGLYSGVTNDFVERPMSDGGTVVLMAAIPFADFGLEPYAQRFASIVSTIRFVDTDPAGVSG